MTMIDLLQSQLLDVFRIGMIVALVATTLRTQAVTGSIVPLLAGVLFIAVIIPMSLSINQPVMPAILTGIVANLILLALALAGLQLYRRIRR